MTSVLSTRRSVRNAWHSDRDAGDAANWVKHHRVIPEQGAEWAAFRERHPDAALCVAGDLNMNLGGHHYYGTKQGRQLLSDAMGRAGLACVTRTEHVPVGKLAKPHIDHVLVPNAFERRSRVVDAWPGTLNGVRLSDHSAVVVDITWSK